MSCQLALALIFGILLTWQGGWQICLLAVLFVLTVLLPQIYRRQYAECALRGALLVAAGVLGMGCQIRQEGRWESEKQELLQGQQLAVCGTLISKEQKNDRWQLTLGLSGYENRVIVSAEDGGYPLDCVLSVRGPVMEFNSPRNEGQFNEKQYYKSKRTVARIYAEKIVCLCAPSGIRAWREWLYQLRMGISGVYEAYLPAQEVGILSTMVVGEKAFLEPDVRTLFQHAGISHMLAISGMHISMIGMSVYGLLRKCRRSYICCALLTAGVLLSYGTMIGLGVSATRAIGMFLIYLLAQCLGRRYDTISALSVLAVLLLTDNPFLLENVSFQFSFLAVFAVVTAAQVLPKKEKVTGWKRWLFPACMAIVLQLFTLPLVAYYYYEVPAYALFLNLLLLPYLGAALGFGLVGGCVGVCLDSFGATVSGSSIGGCVHLLLIPCRVILSVYLWVCETVEQLPFSTVICGKPSAGKLWLYYGLLAGIVLLPECTKKRSSKKKVPEKEKRKSEEEKEGIGWHVYLYVAGSALLLLAILVYVPSGGFEIDYLDVGQGDGSVLRTDDGVVCFVDGGSSDVSDIGTYRILPFLKAKAIRKVDYWILSHLDEDHVNGFYEVLESGYPVGSVVISAKMSENEASTYLSELLTTYEVPVIRVDSGDVLHLHKKAWNKMFARNQTDPDPKDETKTSDPRISVLSPGASTPVFDSNSASLVCLYEDAGTSALWTGDIGKSQEEWLLNGGSLHSVDIYKAAHHGSKYSNSAAYLEALSPKLAIISCGARNRYGHPGAEAVEHIEATGSRILYTMYSGQIKVTRGDQGLTVKEFCNDPQ